MKIHWKMFIYGGLLKLLGDSAALVGPISITKIVDYIDIRLNATASIHAQHLRDHVNHMANALTAIENATTTSAIPITHSANFGNGIRMRSTNNYYLPLSLSPSSSSFLSSPSIDYRATVSANQMPSVAPLIGENAEVYYATWLEFIENGWVMAMLVLFATLAQGTLSQASTHIVNMIGIRLRTSLQSLVYRKTLLISSSTFQSTSIGVLGAMGNEADTSNGYRTNGSLSTGTDDENGDNQTTITGNRETTPKIIKTDSNDSGDSKANQSPADEQMVMDTGKITNLMAEDALNVMSFFWIAHYVWAIPLKVSVSLQFRYLCVSLCVCGVGTKLLLLGHSEWPFQYENKRRHSNGLWVVYTVLLLVSRADTPSTFAN